MLFNLFLVIVLTLVVRDIFHFFFFFEERIFRGEDFSTKGGFSRKMRNSSINGIVDINFPGLVLNRFYLTRFYR